MASNSKNASHRWAALEISRDDLHLAVCEPRPNGNISVQTNSVRWRDQSAALYSDAGRAELSAALRRLVEEHQLAGVPTYLALGGDFCVSRVIVDTAERVEQEVFEFEARSQLYLSLGHGSKAVGVVVRPTDARHRRALLAVANQKTLDTVVAAAGEARLKLRSVEPSLVSLCRFVGDEGHDTATPILLVNFGPNGYEVGISHQGQLWLEYRPAGCADGRRAAALVVEHLERLRRFNARCLRLGDEQLCRAMLCGVAGPMNEALAEFLRDGTLQAETLEVRPGDGRWQFEGDPPATEMIAVLGACLGHVAPESPHAALNLMDRVTDAAHESTLVAWARWLWPLAAMLLVAAVLEGMCFYEQSQLTAMQAELARYEPDRRRTRMTRRELAADRGRLDSLMTLERALGEPAWNELLSTIAGCMSDDMWLSSMAADADGRLTLSGVSHTEEGVFEFIRWLRRVPTVHGVALQSTAPASLGSATASRFQVTCDITGCTNKEDCEEQGI